MKLVRLLNVINFALATAQTHSASNTGKCFKCNKAFSKFRTEAHTLKSLEDAVRCYIFFKSLLN